MENASLDVVCGDWDSLWSTASAPKEVGVRASVVEGFQIGWQRFIRMSNTKFCSNFEDVDVFHVFFGVIIITQTQTSDL